MEEDRFVKPSELRTFLLRYAKRKGIMVHELVSDTPGQMTAYYCHVEPASHAWTATAVSSECPDTALAKAFLYLGNPELDFVAKS